MANNELDVRQLRKPDKHPTIFASYAHAGPILDVLLHVLSGGGTLTTEMDTIDLSPARRAV